MAGGGGGAGVVGGAVAEVPAVVGDRAAAARGRGRPSKLSEEFGSAIVAEAVNEALGSVGEGAPVVTEAVAVVAV